MPQKKMNSFILDANGGLESARALSHARNVLLSHDLKQPVLYHLVLTGSQSIPVYQGVIKSLMRRIRNHGCRLEYFGAYENDEKKGMHAHCYILIETGRRKTPFKLLDVNDGEYLHKLAERHGLVNEKGKTQRIHVSKPKNAMHEGQFFARPTKGEKLDNCLCWIEYPYKQRSKDGIPAREKFFNSEFKANKSKRASEMQQYYAPATPAAPTQQENEGTNEDRTTEKPETNSALGSPANQEGNSTSDKALVCPGQPTSPGEEARSQQEASLHDERDNGTRASPSDQGLEMMLTASQKYLVSLYEQAVDASLDLDEMRRYLLAKGVVKTPGMVAWELEHVAGFYGYAASHQPKPQPSMKDWLRTG
jgi:hypothetical protein